MGNSARSPRVGNHSWGHLEVDDFGKFGDAKLWPGGASEWDWSVTGTHHRPGIQPSDVAALLEHDPEVVVLSRGRELRLETEPATIAALEARNIRVIREETSIAIEEYNRLAAAGTRVAALLHSTC